MKKFIIGYLAFCTTHGRARCHSKMANKNDSSQMRTCLDYSGVSKDGRAESSQEPMHSSAPKRRHTSDSFRTEVADLEKTPGDKCGDGTLRREPECHMELYTLRAKRTHTVLIDTEEFSLGKIIPFSGQHVWDSNHVKLPHIYPRNSSESRWAATVRALRNLTHRAASARDVEVSIKTYNQAYCRDWNFDSLHTFAERVPKHETNFPHVISKMAKLALRLPDLIRHPIPLLRQQQSHAITMSQVQISCLLANAFFCTFPHRNATHRSSEYGNFPTINFSSLLSENSPLTLQKLRALFHYFDAVTDEATKPGGLVTFERICLSSYEWPEWFKRTEKLTKVEVYANGFIEEEGRGMLQVDFAAKLVGGGVLRRGLVQEEIRFLQCPELIVSRLFTEKLADNECLRITGVQTYSNTGGYSDTFSWESPHEDNTQRDEWNRRYCQIVAIDATNFDDPRQQFTKKSIQRELLKAYVGFRGDPSIPTDYTPAVATGNWGCGAFKGDKMLKALIQMMAAAVAQRDLAYFTFNNTKQAEELQKMYTLLKSEQITVGKLYGLLQDYCDYYSLHQYQQQKVMNVFEYIREKIGVYNSHL